LDYRYRRAKPAAATVNKFPALLLIIAVAVFIAADIILKLEFNWVDYLVVVLVALFGLRGYYKGIINTIFSFAGYVAGMVGAYLFTPKLALLIMDKTTIGDKIGEKISGFLPALSSISAIKTNDSLPVADIIKNNPEFSNAIADKPVIKQIIELTASAAETGSMYSENVVTVTDIIVFSLLKVISFIILFFVIKLIIVFIGKLLKTATKKGMFLGTANRAGGLLFGLCIGIIVCGIVFVFAIPVLASLNVIRLPEAYSSSVILAKIQEFLPQIK
jgi:uncharacterized membrane protein required for colicin V production